MNINSPLVRIGLAEFLAKVLSWASLAIIPFFAAPDVYGEVSLHYSLILFLIPFFLFGQDRLILKGESEEESVRSFLFTLVIWLLASGVLLFYDLLLVSIASLLLALNKIYLTFFRAEDKFNSYALNRVIYSASRFFFVIFTVYLFYTPSYYLLSEFFAALIATLGLFVLIVKSKAMKRFSFKTRFLHGLPLMLHGVSLLGIGVADRFILKHYTELSVVGNYSFIYVFASGLIFLYSIISIVQEKKIYKAENKQDLFFHSKKTFLMMVSIGLLGGLGSIVVYYLIFKFDLIQGYGFYIKELLLLLFAHLILPFYLLSNYILIQQDKRTLLLFTSLLSFIVNIVFNLLLVPTYGLQGAVWATLIANVILVVCVTVVCTRVLRINSSFDLKS